MSDETSATDNLGIYEKMSRGGTDPADMIAIILSGLWVVACLAFWALIGFGGGSAFVTLMAVVMPIALIWVAALSAKSARIMREESAHLRASLDSMRQMYLAQAQMSATAMGPNVERKLDELVKGQKKAETALASFATSRPISRRPEVTTDRPATPAAAPTVADSADRPEQPGLDLDTPPEAMAPPVTNADFIVALNFPETADDKAGFDALRRALADPRAARLVQASQDVLTLLSQDGIYMDDMQPDRARPEIWRRFADGERGRTIAALGGIRDRASLALAAQRMRQDQVFRDTSHHFLRTFDKTFVSFAENATDEDIVYLTDTRTARAFMLLGRVAGLFD